MTAKRVVFTIIVCFILLAACFTVIYRGTIFQRGNPLPYISKMVTLNDGHPYAKVFADKDIYIARNTGDNDALIKYIESAYDVTFFEHMGSTYSFYSDEKSIFVDSEIYWKYYTVWDLGFYSADYLNPSGGSTAAAQLPH